MFARSLVLVATLALLATPVLRAEDHPVVKQMKEKLKHPEKPFTMLVTIQVKAGKEKEFEDAFLVAQKGTKKEKGCIAYEINRDTEATDTFVAYTGRAPSPSSNNFTLVPGKGYFIKMKTTTAYLPSIY